MHPLHSMIRTSLAFASVLAMAACSLPQSTTIDYKNVGKDNRPNLEIPPDLTALSKDARYNIVGASVSASSFGTGQSAAPTGSGIASNAINDARIERLGNQRWLVVNRPAEQVWNTVKDFWIDNGFQLTTDKQDIGVMETDWAENRAKIPQDIVRRTLGRVIDGMYDTGERDKFRTRLERSTDGKSTEIYISHRGMSEQLRKDSAGAQTGTTWAPRAADPELETELLRRLMQRLGLPAEKAAALAAANSAVKPSSRILPAGAANAASRLEIDDNFDRAWRRVGLSLDRTGFTVEDRDRAKGIYFVRYVEPIAPSKEPGFFEKLFTSDKGSPVLKYQIAVQSQAQSSIVSVLSVSGAAENSQNAERILKVLADDLR